MKNSAICRQTLAEQLALDYCCTPEQVLDDHHYFTVWQPAAGQRTFQAAEPPALKIAAVSGKLLFSGREDVIRICEKRFADASSPWFMDAGPFAEVNEVLQPFGYKVHSAHPFYLPENPQPVPEHDFSMELFVGDEILRFQGDDRYREAFCFDPNAPDELGVSAVRGGEIIGMAGASRDSDRMWQVGINVEPAARGAHVASVLVQRITEEVFSRGRVPFYGTSMSNIASQRVAYHAGYVPAWVELSTEKITAE